MKTSLFFRTLALLGAIIPLLPVASHASVASEFLPPSDLTPTAFPFPSAPLAASAASGPLTTPLPASSVHGITVRLAREGRVVVATCRYDGGIPVAGALVTVLAPGVDAPYLTGTTDPAGLFTFLPGTPGEWRVVVDDGMGHRREARIDVATGPETGGERDRPEALGLAEHEEHGEHRDHEHHHADHEHDQADHEHDHAESTEHVDPAGGGEHGDPTHDAALIHSQESEGSDRPWKLATGLGLIFGLTGFAYGFTARQQRA
jgi:hypothetical protein